MQIIINPKDRIYTWINGEVFSAEVIYVVKGTSKVKAKINNKYGSIKMLTYGESYSMTYEKAVKSVSEWKREKEARELNHYSKQKAGMNNSNLKVENVKNKSIIKINLCESCGFPIDANYLCKCSN